MFDAPYTGNYLTQEALSLVKGARVAAQRLQALGCAVICLQRNTNQFSTTCMYFPWQPGDTTCAGSTLVPDEILDLMGLVGGGITDLSAKPTAFMRGFSCCRVCRVVNGTSERGIQGYVVPSGANHYVDEHHLPANLFSMPLRDNPAYRIWFVSNSVPSAEALLNCRRARDQSATVCQECDADADDCLHCIEPAPED